MSRVVVAFVGLLAFVACGPVDENDGLDFPSADALGRRIAGKAAPYEAAQLDEALLRQDMKARREAAWETVFKTLKPVALGEQQDSPSIETYQTWYGIDDVRGMFAAAYDALGPERRRARSEFSEQEIAAAEDANASRHARTSQWSLDRYLDFVKSLGQCPAEMPADECASLVEQRERGVVNGTARILYSPKAAKHILQNYPHIISCRESLDALVGDEAPRSSANFTECLDSEFPADSVIVKAQWMRADFGRDIPVFDTSASALRQRLSGAAQWGTTGDRRAKPSPSEIVTIRLRGGETYRLVGLHIMTKELRHWQWVTLWWSDAPDTDFGSDRPRKMSALPRQWRNYKMCTVTDFSEGDSDTKRRFGNQRSLQEALGAIGSNEGVSTWCSNGYLEHGGNNAKTNCIGCHQHAGSTRMFDTDNNGEPDAFRLEDVLQNNSLYPDAGRKKIRDRFPSDYLYAFNRVDDFASVLKREVDFFDAADKTSSSNRPTTVLAMRASVARGRNLFEQNCASCHGEDGSGAGFAANLRAVAPIRTREALLGTLLVGKGAMPSWSTLSDQELADLIKYLKTLRE